MVNFKPIYIDTGSGIVRNPDLTEEEFQAHLLSQREANIRSLWQAAHDYEYEQISGSAVGMLVLGVLQQKPKSLAIQAWIQSIWNLYYQRKALVTDNLDQSYLDFSSCGVIPYTVPELMSEILNA